MVISQSIVSGTEWPPSPCPTNDEERYVIHGISWTSYMAISDALAGRGVPRLTYDCGSLEFMTPSPAHEIFKKRLAWLVETMAFECGQAIETAGNMTFRREDLHHGFEFDDCFWIASESQVRGKVTYDCQVDPPPDLGIEIEISRSAIDRMELFAAMRVREVWRYDGETLTVEVLQADGTYRQSDSSLSFPWAPIDQLASFIEPGPQHDSLTRTYALRQWIAEHRKTPDH
jgi:hypothetical protein